MRTSTLFSSCNYGVFEIYGVSARTREVKLGVRTFFGQGEGVNFLLICADVFYGRPLTHFYVYFGQNSYLKQELIN